MKRFYLISLFMDNWILYNLRQDRYVCLETVTDVWCFKRMLHAPNFTYAERRRKMLMTSSFLWQHYVWKETYTPRLIILIHSDWDHLLWLINMLRKVLNSLLQMIRRYIFHIIINLTKYREIKMFIYSTIKFILYNVFTFLSLTIQVIIIRNNQGIWNRKIDSMRN